MIETVVIVGAGLAGARCAETLRAEGYEGRVVLVGEESVAPYERPALSKGLLTGARSAKAIALRADDYWREQGVELVLGARVTRIDLRGRTAVLESGRSFAWDALVLATGARARAFPGLAPPPGVQGLRTLADALALRGELRPGRRLVIVGAGLIGGEVATSAAALGADVTVVCPGRVPLQAALGLEAGLLLAERYRAHNFELLLGTRVTGFRSGPSSRVCAVLLEDGREIPCQVALVCIGAQPTLPVGVPAGDEGLATDASGRTALPGVFGTGARATGSSSSA
jgi:3-phenylpropionate/trans-cinnamate dioxygenase ferredoxin reductase component